MEQRFQFISPSEREIAFQKQWKFAPIALAFLWLCLNFTTAGRFGYALAIPLLGLGVLAGWLNWCLNDIRRRSEQATFGSIELAAWELRVRLTERSLLRVRWDDFRGADVKKGWLQLNFLDAQIEQGQHARRLDRVRLSELEQPDALLQALRAQTGAS